LLDCSPTNTAATVGSAFSHDQQLKQQLQERLHQGPGEEARQQAAATPQGPPPVRWTLDSIRATFDWLADYTASGVWRLLDRLGLRLRSARVQQFSPDPQYADKLIDLEMALWEARRYPRSVVAVFLDEAGFTRWPDPAPDWDGTPPVADRRGANNGLWRLIGGLNALTGQVSYLDNYIIGRAKVTQFYGQLVETYPQARRLYVIQDNWSIHKNPEVLEALTAWPQVEPVWLPTYAPWLNPIEKLWRWLKQDVLKMHRLADNWQALRGCVRAFLEQFAHGSQRLREYVGLLGNGQIARMIHGP
jgi:transposase